MDEGTGNVVAFNGVQVSEVSFSLKCWRGRELTSLDWQQTPMYPSAAACARTTYTLVISRMCGICPSGWSADKQCQSKGLWGVGPVDTVHLQPPLLVCGNMWWPCPAFVWKGEVCWIMSATGIKGLETPVSISAGTNAVLQARFTSSLSLGGRGSKLQASDWLLTLGK